MMKVLFCQPTMQFSGSENSLLQLVNILKNDIDLNILVGERGPFEQKISESVPPERIRYVRSTKLSRSLSSITDFIFSFWRIFLFFRKAKKNRLYDKIIVNTLMFPQAYFCAWLNGFSVLTICRENPKTYGKIAFFIYASLAMICNNRIILLFHKQQNYFPLSKASEKFIVIPNTIALIPDRKNEKSNNECFIVLSVMGMSVRKGINDLFAITKEIYEKHKDEIVFHIVGSRNEEIIQEFYDKNPHLRSTVKFFGVKSAMDVFYRDADVFLHPSHTEALPRVVLEAAAHGLPVVATNVGGTYTMVRPNENGFLFEPGSHTVAVQAISALMLNKNGDLESYGRNSKEIFTETFSPDKIKRQLIELIYHGTIQK